MSIYKTTTAFKKIATMKNPIRIVQGGKGCSKTISILQLFIFYMISNRENLILSVVAESLPNLKSGALRDFDKILKDMGLYEKFEVNKTDKTYTYGSNLIEFFSVDGESSRLGSRRTHLYINEGDNIKFDTFLELQGRTSDFTIIDFNPRRSFWAHEELDGQPNVDFIILNYLDNEYIPEQELESIMFYKRKWDETGSPFWQNKWRVLGLGELGVVDGVIFEEGSDWDIVDTIPEEARYIGAGLDFGFTHVTAIVKLYETMNDSGDRTIIMHQSLFKAGMTTPRIVQHIKQDVELMDSAITCDSARPEMINEMRAYGCPVVSHKKRDVMSGIDLMHTYKKMITRSSEEMIDEFRSYSYAKDRSGKSLGVPNKSADVDNSIDATRYAFERFLSQYRNRTNQLKWVS
mgnify:CR=1 FL=1